MTLARQIALRSAQASELALREPGLAVALSGGGYRAMLFHLGALRRLNEFGLLADVQRVSSVSGGSLASGVLAVHWRDLGFDANGVAGNFEVVERGILEIADRTVDVRSAILGLRPGTTGAAELARILERTFGSTGLNELGDTPRFTFNSLNMETGNLFRWSSEYGADYGLGKFVRPSVKLAEVIAASAAFPPFLSPLRIPVPGRLVDHVTQRPLPAGPAQLVLTDGGVYDNLGIENVKSFHTVLASDGGAPFGANVKVRGNLFSQAHRTMLLLNEHVGRQRRRTLVSELQSKRRLGALWTIGTPIDDYPAELCLPCPAERTRELAMIRTRLKRFPPEVQYRLANWGYASADAAIRSYVEPSFEPPAGFPYPGGV